MYSILCYVSMVDIKTFDFVGNNLTKKLSLL